MRRNSTLLLCALCLVLASTVYLMWQNQSIPTGRWTTVAATSGIGIYWDSAATNSCQSIRWGTLGPGSSRTFVVFIKNEGTESLYYLLTTQQWMPANVSSYLPLRWTYDGSRADPGSALQVALTLSLYPGVYQSIDFTFNILVMGSRYVWGDLNLSGLVDVRDIAIVAKAYGSQPGSPNWNVDADINIDAKVDTKDIMIVSKNYGKTGS